jgi:hypothetical protein
MPRSSSRAKSSAAEVESSRGGSSAAGSSGRSKALDLKGESAASAVGHRIHVLYDEGGSELVEYRGVVVFLEPHR